MNAAYDGVLVGDDLDLARAEDADVRGGVRRAEVDANGPTLLALDWSVVVVAGMLACGAAVVGWLLLLLGLVW